MSVKIAVNAASGRMGQQVLRQISRNPKAELSAAFCRPKHRLLGRPVANFNVIYSANRQLGLADSDVVIDFSLPDASKALIADAVATQTPALIGTTGFQEQHLEAMRQASKKIPVLLAPNTSIGVNLTLTLLAQAAKAIGAKADIEIIEAHHKHKVDAPSGTALRMGSEICKALGTELDKQAVYQRVGRAEPRQQGEIGFSVIRAGEIIGEHEVIFALDNEVISIKHKAQNRDCFAEGAVTAAIWLASQKPGLYSMQDFIAAQ